MPSKSIIIVGDVAIYPGEEFVFVDFPNSFLDSHVCFNLEGSIDISISRPSNGVFNSPDILQILHPFASKSFFLANNHVSDLPHGVNSTISFLDSHLISHFGAGSNTQAATRPFFIHDFLLVGFGWPAIGCKPSTTFSPGTNPLTKNHVLDSVRILLDQYPDLKIIPIFHSNYEFELYPQPFQRDLSRRLIDLGCFAIVGHHPHIQSHIEFYRGAPIVYSLGNFAFSYGKYFDGKLIFPPHSFNQIAVELSSDSFKVHRLLFEPPNKVIYLYPESLSSSDLYTKCPYKHMTSTEYTAWFSHHRLKHLFLPVFKFSDSKFLEYFKILYVIFRHLLINIMIFLRLRTLQRRSG